MAPVKFLQVYYPDHPELNRIQANVAEALRQLELSSSSVESTCCGESLVPTVDPGTGGTTPGTIPARFSIAYTFAATMDLSNNLRSLRPGSDRSVNISAQDAEMSVPMPFAGTLSMLSVTLSTGFPNAGPPPNGTAEYRVRKNGVAFNPAGDTKLVCALTAADSGGTFFYNYFDVVNVVAGDRISVTYYPITMGGSMNTIAATANFVLVSA